jgi:glycerol-1-phosphatase
VTEHAAAARATNLPGRPQASERPLSEVYDVGLLDLDGVVYLGSSAVPGAAEALEAARRAGMRLAFVTNNASRSPSTIAAQLNRLGVPASPAEVVTSAHAAARLIAERLPPGSPVLVVGGIGLRIALRERGLRPVSTAAERPAAVVQGYGPDIGYGLLAEGELAVRAGAWFVASNVDVTLPTARGLQPGNGSLVQVIATATGQQPAVAGKPEPPLHAEAVERTGARRPLVVGDRLDTDIEGAVRVGADSMLVLTGVTGPAEAVLAPPGQRPAYLAHDLAGLLEPHPAVTAEAPDTAGLAPGTAAAAGRTFHCGGWAVRLLPAGGGRAGADGQPDPAAGGQPGGAAGGQPDPAADGQPDPATAGHAARLEIEGTGNALDGLRALCAAAWSAGSVSPDSVQSAVQHLPFPSR